MKFTWEAIDIETGTRVGCVGVEEKWVIGYLVDSSTYRLYKTEDEVDERRYVVVSLKNGAVSQPFTKSELAEDLNIATCCPESYLEPVE